LSLKAAEDYYGVVTVRVNFLMLILAQVMTWGYKMVTPRRVIVARDIRKKGPHPLKYHRADRLHVVAIAAGMTHSTVVTDDGLIFYWVSADPHLRPHQVNFSILDFFKE
jgi:hypothetical protein